MSLLTIGFLPTETQEDVLGRGLALGSDASAAFTLWTIRTCPDPYAA